MVRSAQFPPIPALGFASPFPDGSLPDAAVAEALVMFDDLEHDSGAIERDRKGPFSGPSVSEFYSKLIGQTVPTGNDWNSVVQGADQVPQ